MAYLLNNGTGYMKDAVQVAGKPSYLYIKSGYSGSSTYSGYQGFGDRIEADNGIIESYTCASAAILATPIANIGRQLFDAYDARVQAASGDTEARDCTITELYELKQE